MSESKSFADSKQTGMSTTCEKHSGIAGSAGAETRKPSGIRVRSGEARRELAKAWPPEMVALLQASAKVFGQAEEIIVEDEPTIRHLQAWKKAQEQAQKVVTVPTARAEIAKQKAVLGA